MEAGRMRQGDVGFAVAQFCRARDPERLRIDSEAGRRRGTYFQEHMTLQMFDCQCFAPFIVQIFNHKASMTMVRCGL